MISENYSDNPRRMLVLSHFFAVFCSVAEPNNPHDSHIKWQQIYSRRSQRSVWQKERGSGAGVKLSDNGRQKKKSGAQWDSGSRSNCNVLLPLTTQFVPIPRAPLSPFPFALIWAMALSIRPSVCPRACVCVCVCCAFAALIPFNTNRIERSAISCDENINKKQHTEKQKPIGASKRRRMRRRSRRGRRRNLSINTYYIVALVAIVVAEQEIKIVQVLCRDSKR